MRVDRNQFVSILCLAAFAISPLTATFLGQSTAAAVTTSPIPAPWLPEEEDTTKDTAKVEAGLVQSPHSNRHADHRPRATRSANSRGGRQFRTLRDRSRATVTFCDTRTLPLHC